MSDTTPAMSVGSAPPAGPDLVGGRSRWWRVPEVLVAFAAAGVLERGEVQLAAALVRLADLEPAHADTEAVALAAALAVRARRLGHVGVDLAVAEQEVEALLAEQRAGSTPPPGSSTQPGSSLPWPEAATWLDRVAASSLVQAVDGQAAEVAQVAQAAQVAQVARVAQVAPLVVHGGLLYLERSRAEERAVVRSLSERTPRSTGTPPVGADSRPGSSAGIAAELLTGPGSDRQLAAVRSSFDHRLTVLLGGPGTGKTTTVAALVAALSERGDGPASIALAAPTGKAAARLGEAFRAAAALMPAELSHLADVVAATSATTIHRLLGPRRAGSSAAFRHHGQHPLPHDLVIVDESSMISMPLMARLLDAVGPDARLVVVGDPDQLASVEAGSVLGDIARAADDGAAIAAAVTRLEHSRRFPPGSSIADLATAVRVGDADGALAVLAGAVSSTDPTGRLGWVDQSADHPATADAVRSLALPVAREVVGRAAVGAAAEALGALGRLRVLAARRTGAGGVASWNQRFEAWLGVPSERWYVGRPVLVTENDHRNRLYNGDLGVVVEVDGRRLVAFPDADGVRFVGPSRLQAIETTHAMTIHKSQGSEFDEVVVVLPPPTSPLASRELLYTAVTRARSAVTVIGDADSVRAAVERRTVRRSRLAEGLLAERSVAP